MAVEINYNTNIDGLQKILKKLINSESKSTHSLNNQLKEIMKNTMQAEKQVSNYVASRQEFSKQIQSILDNESYSEKKKTELMNALTQKQMKQYAAFYKKMESWSAKNKKKATTSPPEINKEHIKRAKEVVQSVQKVTESSMQLMDSFRTISSGGMQGAKDASLLIGDSIHQIGGLLGNIPVIGGVIEKSFSGISGIVKEIGAAIGNQVGQEERKRIELEKQRAQLTSQFELTKKLIAIGSQSMDAPNEIMQSYATQLNQAINQANQSMNLMNMGDMGDKDASELLHTQLSLQNKIASAKGEIALLEKQGRKTDKEKIQQLQTQIEHYEKYTQDIQWVLDLQSEMKQTLKDANAQALKQVNWASELGQSEQLSLQMKHELLSTMIHQKDIHDDMLYSEEERKELLIQQQQIMSQMLKNQQEIEFSIMRQQGYTEDSILWQIENLEYLNDNQLAHQKQLHKTIQSMGGEEVFDRLVHQYQQLKTLDDAATTGLPSMLAIDFQNQLRAFGLSRQEFEQLMQFDAKKLNDALVQEDNLTRTIIDSHFQNQERMLQHQLHMGEISQDEYNLQYAALIENWEHIYSEAKAAMVTGATDSTAFTQLIHAMAEQLGVSAEALGQISLENLIITDEDIMDIQEKGRTAGDALINGMQSGLTQKDAIDYQIEQLNHALEMGFIQESQYEEKRMQLLNKQLSLLDTQRSQVLEGLTDESVVTEELWEIDKQRWGIQEDIRKTLQQQTEEKVKQASLDDNVLQKLAKQRQMLISTAQSKDTMHTMDVQNQLHTLESQIISRMQELGADDTAIFSAKQAMNEQRSFETGGWIPSEGEIYAHKGEFVLPEKASHAINQTQPTLLQELQALKTPSQAEAVLAQTAKDTQRTQTITHAMQQTIYQYGGNTLDFSIAGANPQEIAAKVMQQIKQSMPELVREANKRRVIKETR